MPLLFAERLRFMQTRNADEMQRPKPLHLKKIIQLLLSRYR